MTFHVVVIVFLCCGYSCVGLYHIPLSCCQVRMDPGANVLDGFLRETGSAERYGCQQRGIDECFLFHGSLLVWDCDRTRKESTSRTTDSRRYLSVRISRSMEGLHSSRLRVDCVPRRDALCSRMRARRSLSGFVEPFSSVSNHRLSSFPHPVFVSFVTLPPSQSQSRLYPYRTSAHGSMSTRGKVPSGHSCFYSERTNDPASGEKPKECSPGRRCDLSQVAYFGNDTPTTSLTRPPLGHSIVGN